MKAKVLDSSTAKVVLFGGGGYVGKAFKKALDKRGIDYFAPESSMINLLHVQSVEVLLEAMRPSFLINCAGYTGKPNVDACEDNQNATTEGNVNTVFNLSQICEKFDISWGHVSSGCIYNGYEKEFTEEDEPNFCFDSLPCSFYSGTKAEAEKILTSSKFKCYTWRLRIPFNEQDNSRNYLTKLQRYTTLLNVPNSMSHLNEYAEKCLELWEMSAPFGIYNIVNSGALTAEETLAKIRKHIDVEHKVKFMDNIEEFYDVVSARTPRSNCILSNKKLLDTGIKIRDTEEAIDHALQNWDS